MSALLRGLLFLFFLLPMVSVADSFVVRDIRVEGLQRISVGAVFNAIPVSPGATATPELIAQTIRALYQTANFHDVSVLRDGDVLILRVQERSSIAALDIEGNKSIKTEQLLDGLAQSGLSEGAVFQRATLDRIKLELERQYIAQGRYAASVEPTVTPLPRNRVKIEIAITEGDVARIAGIDIVGNYAFPEEELLDLMTLKVTHLTSFFKGDDKYAREKLSGDLESIRSHYLDRGYVNFMIRSTQVTVTPDKEKVYITVNVDEGDVFTIKDVKLSGELKVAEEELNALLLVRTDQKFSRQLITLTNELLTTRLGNEGYTFANVNGVPDVDNDNKTVNVTFYVDAGPRVYVRRINFYGNEKTQDKVLRREMRQMEGAWANGQAIQNSRVRLERLGYFSQVNVETPRVAGEEDQVDVNFTVEEQPSGSIGASLGFQQGTGVVFGASISQSNFLGTGNRVSMSINRSSFRNSYNFSFVDPYFTIDGVSRGYSLFYQETKIEDSLNISSYATDRLGGNVTFGYPIDETQRLSFGAGLQSIKVFAGRRSSLNVWDFINYDHLDSVQNTRLAQSARYGLALLSANWSDNALNRGVFATRGYSQQLSLDLTAPGSDLEYFRLNYNGQLYLPLPKSWVLRINTDIGYGEGYGEDDALPFFEHFFAGGFGSVRGFDDRTLGPKEVQSLYDFGRPDAFGGNLLVQGTFEFIFPMPWVKDNRSMRPAFFIDWGNVFDTVREDDAGLRFDVDEFRYSAGIGLSWLTGIGPLAFSVAKAFNVKDGDETRVFQFSLGQPF